MRLPALLVVLLSTLITGNAHPQDQDQKLVICARGGPFFFAQEGHPGGLEHDLLKGFSESSNREVEIIWAESFASALSMVEQGLCDIAAARITVTDERSRRLDFSAPYFPVMLVLVNRIDSPVTSLEQLAGKTVIVKQSTIYEDVLSRAARDINFVYSDRDDKMFAAVVAAKAEALVCDSAVVLSHLEKHPVLRIVTALTNQEHYGFALQKGSPLTPRLDAYLRSVRSDGTYQQLLQLYFGDMAELITEPQTSP
jgi:ABC-type amino acid transport substrate-binding protein